MFKTNKSLKREIEELENEIERLKRLNTELVKLMDATPGDCKLGNYCNACVFSINHSQYLGFGVYNHVHYCAKGDCPSFVLKEEFKKEGD